MYEPEVGGVHDGELTPYRVAVAVSSDRDRSLLSGWFDANERHEARPVAPDESLPDAYDLCVLDEAALAARRETLATARRTADPLYLPHLLAVETGRNAEVGDDAPVDDVIPLPVEKATLGRRVRNLLQARRASVRLAEREQQYRRLVQLTPEAVVLVDGDELIYANDATAELVGADGPAEVRGRDAGSLVTEPDRDRLDELLATVRAEGRSGEFVEFDVRGVDDRTVPVAAAGVEVGYDGRPVCQLVVRDLSERKRRQERLDLFGRAIETAAQGITVADAQRDGEPLIYANRAFERITGYSQAEVLGRNCRFLQGEGTDPETVAELAAAVADRRGVTVELLNYRKDGTPFWNRLDVVPVTDDAGQTTHLLGLQRDVTERKEREQRLAVLDRLLRHNLRNRMNVIRGYAEEIAAAGDGPAGAAATHITEAADDLLRLVDRIRAFRGVVVADDDELETVDLVSVLSEAARDIAESRTGTEAEAEAEAGVGAGVTLDLPERAPVQAHRTLPEGVSELLRHAAGDEGVTAALRVDDEADTVSLTVRDCGGTIPPGELRVLAGARETALDHLEGIELWLVRWAVEHSGGEFAVDPDAEPARVRLSVPRAAAATAETDGGTDTGTG